MDILSLILFALAAIGVGGVAAIGAAYFDGRSLVSSMLPTPADFARYRVTNPDQSEVVRQRLYDYLLYPAAGATQLSFFSQQAGQGITTAQGAAVGSAKTLWDTNMSLSNQLPSGSAFKIETIEVVLVPGSSSTANTFIPQLCGNFEATAADAAVASFNDINLFYQSGLLELNILQKNYLRETPLIAFPPKVGLGGAAAVASNGAATGLTSINAITAQGRPYDLSAAEITLQPAVNFEVVLRWPGVVAMPSTFNARVGVILDGYFLRASQ
jgi:hypothetical protein